MEGREDHDTSSPPLMHGCHTGWRMPSSTERSGWHFEGVKRRRRRRRRMEEEEEEKGISYGERKKRSGDERLNLFIC